MTSSSHNSATRDTSFAKNSRLITPSDYKRVFDNVTVKLHQPNLFALISVQENSEQLTGSDSRLGLAVSKAKNKHAVERNRIKRLVREYFRNNAHTLPKAVDMVYMVKTSTKGIANEEIVNQLEAGFKRAVYKLNK